MKSAISQQGVSLHLPQMSTLTKKMKPNSAGGSHCNLIKMFLDVTDQNLCVYGQTLDDINPR